MRAVSHGHVCSRGTCVRGFLACVPSSPLQAGAFAVPSRRVRRLQHDAQAPVEDDSGVLRGRRVCARLRRGPELAP
jgi:hypothetical protein